MKRNRPRYYRVRNGRVRWEPTARMCVFGFKSQALGPDCDEARASAERLNATWDVVRQGAKASDETIAAAGYAPSQAERARAAAVLDHIYERILPFVNSSEAGYLVKGMRSLAWHLERRARDAARQQLQRDVLGVAS